MKNKQLSEHGHLIGRNQKIKLLNQEIAKKLDIEFKIQNTLDKIDSDISKKQKRLEHIRNELKSITAELSYNENDTIRFESSHIQGLQIIKK